MRDFDATMDEAVRAEERELLRRIGEEPGYLDQALSIFGGRAGWVSVVLMTAQTALFGAGVWAAWGFFQAGDVLSALRWGLPAAVLLLMSLMVKLSLAPTIQTNRVLRELRRLELQIVQRQGE
jgi:hypothetical protein